MARINANVFVDNATTITASAVDIPPQLADEANLRVVLMLDQSAVFLSAAAAARIVEVLLPHIPTTPTGEVMPECVITSDGTRYAVDL